MSRELPLRFHDRVGSEPREQPIQVGRVVIASWTGRDREGIERRLIELEELGICRPPFLPMLYGIAAARASCAPTLEVLGTHTTGEVEPVILNVEGHDWIGVGSDHTDRQVEASGAALAKQLCDKPVGEDFWSVDSVSPHWDDLILESFITEEGGKRMPYQMGTLASILPLRSLLALRDSTDASSVSGATLLFCGTLPTIGPIRGARIFECSLVDPILKRRIVHSYRVHEFPSHLTPSHSQAR